MSYVGLPTCLYRTLDIWLSTLDLSTLYNYVLQLGFSHIRNNQGRDKCYQPSPEPKPKAEADNTYRDHDYLGYHKNQI